MKKLIAILEVLSVKAAVFFIIFGIRLTPLWEWQRAHLKSEFINTALMFFIPLLIVIAMRRDFQTYGLSFKNPGYHLKTALVCLIPVAIANQVFAFVDKTTMSGALILAADMLMLLLVLALLLRREPGPVLVTVSASIFLALIAYYLFTRTLTAGEVQDKIVKFAYYLFFVGFGEEMMNRGYIQSRLNTAFGRPFTFFGVSWGWGLVISAIIFGLGHVFAHFNPFLGELNWNWWWGFWTVFSGLVFGFLREKTGSILVPALVHGLPLAFASLFFGV